MVQSININTIAFDMYNQKLNGLVSEYESQIGATQRGESGVKGIGSGEFPDALRKLERTMSRIENMMLTLAESTSEVFESSKKQYTETDEAIAKSITNQ